MLKLARGSSNISVSSSDYEVPSVPKREAQKRKGVHFSDHLDVLDVSPCRMSTSSFLRQKGLAWNSLARAFDCEDEITKDDAVMNELLNLCSFWSDKEPIFKGPNDDSDSEDDSDGEDFEAFEQHVAMLASTSKPRVPTISSSSSSGVSSLRLNSLMRLNSESSRFMSSSETLSCLSKSPPSFNGSSFPKASSKKRSSPANELENAFRGIVEDDNEFSQDSVFSANVQEDDFWSQVEF
ncbi:hypothetical protein Q1695_004535 [Nippostrongylus brasiliensis]|nr:hypothetical protein Q1695_004535 [Nippostrongylus brasiliensis]